MLTFNDLLLYYLSEDTFFLDLVDIMGMEKTIKFISVFGGLNIDVPSRGQIKEKIIDLKIFLALHKNPDNHIMLKQLSSMFDCSISELKLRFKKIKKSFIDTKVTKLAEAYLGIDAVSPQSADFDRFIGELS